MASPPKTCTRYRNSAKLDPVFRERVRSELEVRGWNMLRLSKESGVTYSVIHDWLSDANGSKKGPTTQVMEKIFAALDLDVPPSKLAKRKGAK